MCRLHHRLVTMGKRWCFSLSFHCQGAGVRLPGAESEAASVGSPAGCQGSRQVPGGWACPDQLRIGLSCLRRPGSDVSGH